MRYIPDVITIDGTAASGKTTVGKMLSKRLNYLFFDTGIMYRVAAYASLKKLGSVSDEESVTKVVENADIELRENKKTQTTDVYLYNENVTKFLHTPEVDKIVSISSAYPGVRKSLTAHQRKIGLNGRVVMVGRDIGTVVLPEAKFKFYLKASPEIRARRRFEENTSLGIHSDYETILKDIIKRDQIDSSRKIAPLRPADDAIIIDTDHLTADQVFDTIIQHMA